MVLMNSQDISKEAEEVLRHNDLGDWTSPQRDIYPHQWFWDSCFSAMGWAHIDVDRAERELFSLMRGQWKNGMIPNMIFEGKIAHSKHLPKMWDSHLSPYAPSDVETTGITQPPMLAEAVNYLGQQMEKSKRVQFYKKMLPHMIAYHTWIYEDRDPHHGGLALLIHPWETGLDDTPPWMVAMQRHSKPYWIKFIQLAKLDKLIEAFRRDTQQISPDERASTIESLLLYSVTRRLKKKNYDTSRVLSRSHFLIEDLFFNSILIRANTHLKNITQEARMPLPRQLISNMNRASKSLEELWDEQTEQYYSRYFISREKIFEQTIATLLPLYSGAISKKRAEVLVDLLHRHDMFASNFPVPSVPLSSDYFSHRRYWQGPVWLNTNWLIYDGLMRYGFTDEAELIKRRSLELVSRAGFHEYFSPIDGYGAGIEPFSWTAALAIVFDNQ